MNWHEYFTYDAATGNLVWKVRPVEHFKSQQQCNAVNGNWAGKVAGCVSSNRGKPTAVYVLVNGKRCMAHRIIWEMFYGAIPDGKMPDHKDRNGINNRVHNLRLATYQQNNRNRGVMKNNTSGVTGVFWEKGHKKWKAQIFVDGKNILLGRFNDMDSAVSARQSGEAKYFQEFTAQAA